MSTTAIVLVIAGALALLDVVVIGIFASLAIFGARRYLVEAKMAEAKNSVGAMARGLVTCMEVEAPAFQCAASA